MIRRFTWVLFGTVSFGSEGDWITQCDEAKIDGSEWDLTVQLENDESSIRIEMENQKTLQCASQVFDRGDLTEAGISTQMPMRYIGLDLQGMCHDQRVSIEQRNQQHDSTLNLKFSQFAAPEIPDTEIYFTLRVREMEEERVRALFIAQRDRLKGSEDEVSELRANLAAQKAETEQLTNELNSLKQGRVPNLLPKQRHALWQWNQDSTRIDEGQARSVIKSAEQTEWDILKETHQKQMSQMVGRTFNVKMMDMDYLKISDENGTDLTMLGFGRKTASLTHSFINGNHFVQFKLVNCPKGGTALGLTAVDKFVADRFPGQQYSPGVSYVCHTGELWSDQGTAALGQKAEMGDVIGIRVQMHEQHPSLSTVTFSKNGEDMVTRLLCELFKFRTQLIFTVSLVFKDDRVQIIQ